MQRVSLPFFRMACGVLGAMVLAVSIGNSLLACASMHGRDELDERLFLHHNNLRWGRLGNAATMVAPDLRASFLAEWTARSGVIELQDVEVTAVVLAPDGETADVVVAFVWVERDTMSVKQGVATEVWRKTQSGWQLERPAQLPPG